MSEELNKAYYAVIPANVRYDTELPPNAKLLYGEITALCNAKGYCWASNKYFAELYGVSIATIKRWIKSLIDRGFINSRLIYKDGSKEIDTRWLQICTEGSIKNEPRGSIKNEPDNNTIINNTVNNTINNTIMHGATDADTVPEEPPIVKLILNDKSFYNVCQSQIDHWQELYPAADVKQQLLKMQGWLESNPTRRKTKRGINAFITNWLSREQDKGNVVKLPYPTAQNATDAKNEGEKDYLSGWKNKTQPETYYVDSW